MAEIKRRTLYQPQNVSQGFNPVKAADVTPFLRENERRRQGNQQQIDRAAARDLKTEQINLDLEAVEADKDLKPYLHLLLLRRSCSKIGEATNRTKESRRYSVDC